MSLDSERKRNEIIEFIFIYIKRNNNNNNKVYCFFIFYFYGKIVNSSFLEGKGILGKEWGEEWEETVKIVKVRK